MTGFVESKLIEILGYVCVTYESDSQHLAQLSA